MHIRFMDLEEIYYIKNIALSENSFYVRLKNDSSILRPKEDTAPLCGRLSMQPVHPYSNLGSSAWYS